MPSNVTLSTWTPAVAVADPVSDRVRDMIVVVSSVVLTTAISVTGIVSNIVNLIVYKRYVILQLHGIVQ